MLVLSRHRDESIIIGDNIVITIVDVRDDKVRLGIDAPIEVPVHRSEVYEAIKKDKEEGFSRCMDNSKYIDAYNIFFKRYFTPSASELSALEKGLQELGELTDKRKEYINKYKNKEF